MLALLDWTEGKYKKSNYVCSGRSWLFHGMIEICV